MVGICASYSYHTRFFVEFKPELSLPQVGVHIADVTHFVAAGSALDQEASSRSTSTYLVERRLDMLPGMLTETLCSLKPNVDRYDLLTSSPTPKACVNIIHTYHSTATPGVSPSLLLTCQYLAEKSDVENRKIDVPFGIQYCQSEGLYRLVEVVGQQRFLARFLRVRP